MFVRVIKLYMSCLFDYVPLRLLGGGGRVGSVRSLVVKVTSQANMHVPKTVCDRRVTGRNSMTKCSKCPLESFHVPL